jgi:hypothetical protein
MSMELGLVVDHDETVAHASDGQFGFKARCTMLPADRLRELDKALAFDTLECGGHLYKGGVCVGPVV